jgi:hypothetical protein
MKTAIADAQVTRTDTHRLWSRWQPERPELLEELPHPTSAEYAAYVRRLWRRWEPQRQELLCRSQRQ